MRSLPDCVADIPDPRQAQGRRHRLATVLALAAGATTAATPKKVGTLAPEGDEKGQQTNEIKMAAPRLDAIEIQGQDITADALLTQRQFAIYRVEDRQAYDHFTIKGNPPTRLEDVTLHFAQRQEPDFVEAPTLEHGRIETRKIWARAALNDDLNFPHGGQIFLVERERLDQKTGQHATELAYGITSRPPEQADAQRL